MCVICVCVCAWSWVCVIICVPWCANVSGKIISGHFSNLKFSVIKKITVGWMKLVHQLCQNTSCLLAERRARTTCECGARAGCVTSDNRTEYKRCKVQKIQYAAARHSGRQETENRWGSKGIGEGFLFFSTNS